MDKAAFGFLSELLATPTVSGFEQRGAAVVKKWLKPHVDEVRTDVHGNTFFALNPDGGPRVMIASHIDQIGFLVNHITEQGYLYLVPVGGIDVTVVPGCRLTVHGAGGAVQAVVGRKAIHLMKEDERGGGKKLDLAELAVDIGAKNKEEALKRVQIGDPVTFQLGVARLGDDLITGPALDDRVGVWVMAEALRIIGSDAKKRKRLKAAVFGVATVQEEIGLRGALTAANHLAPQVGIAVDVTHATDSPGIDEKAYGVVKMGGGPVVSIGANINGPLNALMMDAAKAAGVPVQREASPRATGTDANTMQISRGGVATALLSLPCRYMHTPVEVVSLKDLQAAAEMLAEVLLRIDGKVSFIPT
jgi:endoglucanase